MIKPKDQLNLVSNQFTQFDSLRFGPSTLCHSARGLVACLPVRLLFKSTKHNAF